jgi:glycosyltransferase involved in cell wall biosynthesis
VRIAWFTPILAPSAIAQFSRHVVEGLTRVGVSVELWVDEERGDEGLPAPVINYTASPDALAGLGAYDHVVYNMGNSVQFHDAMYRVLSRVPGVVVLHDMVLHHFFLERLQHGASLEAYLVDMELQYGEKVRRRAEASTRTGGAPFPANDHDLAQYPYFLPALRSAEGVVVHSTEHRRLIEASWCGPVLSSFFPAYGELAAELQGSKGAATDRVRLLSFGLINRHKCIDRVIDALALVPDVRQRFEYVVLGRGDPAVVAELQRRIAASELEGCVRLVGHQPEDMLRAEIAAADMFINLRDPAIEGGSASLMMQLAAGKPVVVHPTGCFADVPDAALMKVPAGATPELAAAIVRLAADPDLRQSIGDAARNYCLGASVERYVELLVEFLPSVRSWRPLFGLTRGVGSILHDLGAPAGAKVFDTTAHEIATMFSDPKQDGA